MTGETRWQDLPAALRRDDAKEAVTRCLLHDLIILDRRDDDAAANQRGSS